MTWLRFGRSFSRSTTLRRPMDSVTLLTWSEPLVALALRGIPAESLICGPAFRGTRRSATECTWLHVVIEPNSNARWLLPLFRMPARGKTVISPLICSQGSCGEDDRGGSPFVAGYGAGGSSPCPWPHRERGGQVVSNLFLPPPLPRSLSHFSP
jgi:hypothetical protein